MPVDVIMPRVDMTMERGTIRSWKAEPGAPIREGALLFEIETDKSTMEIDAPASGILGPILVPAGVEVPVGTVVARILALGEHTTADPGRFAGVSALAPAPETRPSLASPPGRLSQVVAPVTIDLRPRATPLARRLAREHGLDLACIAGTGPRGRIGRADVDAAVARVAPRPDVAELPPAMIPAETFQSMVRIDLSVLAEIRSRMTIAYGNRRVPGIGTLMVRILGAALRLHPEMLSDRGRGSLNIGIVFGGDTGMTRIATLADAGGLRAPEISAVLLRLAEPMADPGPTPNFIFANVGVLGIASHHPALGRGAPAMLVMGEIDEAGQALFTFTAHRDGIEPLAALRFLSTLRRYATAPFLVL